MVRGDSKLVGLFLCDDCKELFKSKLFSGTEPSFTYSPVTGYCSYCGLSKQVQERFWYLCGICERIVKSYAAERAATSFILEWWSQASKSDENIKKIELKRTDPVRLMSFEEHQKWKESAHVSNPDFTGVRTETDRKVFAVEMKTGRSSIKKMSAFQLDVSDCDDILSFVKSLRVPSYVFHVQVVEEFQPPTFRKVAINGWWASVFDMEKAFTETRTRQREQRPAAYFKRTAFKPLDEFAGHLRSEQYDEINKKLQKRLPKLYKLKKRKSRKKH
ncbi:MAG: hypothetical protein WB643_00255 [Candidatus Bathyarchaeia archaeon]